MFGLTTHKKAADKASLAYRKGLMDGQSRQLQTENVIANLSVQLSQILEKFENTLTEQCESVGKEAAYRGAETGLKHAVEQILEILDFEMMYTLWKDKHDN